MTKTKVLIYVKGGLVRYVNSSDESLEVIVWDQDSIEDCDPNEDNGMIPEELYNCGVLDENALGVWESENAPFTVW